MTNPSITSSEAGKLGAAARKAKLGDRYAEALREAARRPRPNARGKRKRKKAE